MQLSTLSANQEYLTFLKVLGIFPYKLKYDETTRNSTGRETKGQFGGVNKKLLSAVGFHRRGFFAAWHYLVIAFFYIYLGFHIIRFIDRAISGSGAIELFGMSSWIWKPLFVSTSFVHFHRRRDEICKWHNNWHRVECEIYQEWNLTLPTKVSNIYKQTIQGQRIVHVIVPIWTVVLLTWMMLNQLNSPTFPSYISSFIGNPLDPEKFGWLFHVSFAIQLLALIPILLTYDHFYILGLIFSRSISRLLILITEPFESPEAEMELVLRESDLINTNSDVKNYKMFQVSSFFQSSPCDDNNNCQKTVTKLKLAMQHFGMVEKLVKEFNSVYQWIFFLYQAVIMANFCILIFVPLRFSKIFPWTSLIVFFVACLFFSFHIMTLLPSMGAVLENSSEFQKMWERRLARVANSIQFTQFFQLKTELNSCLPFGFQTGTFYTVTPGSMLVFFSIATSYLIVLLQLDIGF